MQTGIIRRATREDLPRLSRLVARERIDRRELARMMGRGTVLVLDTGERLGGAAYTWIEDTDLEGRVVFRILGVDPAFAERDVERRLAICMLATCRAARQRGLALLTRPRLERIPRAVAREPARRG